MVDQCGGKQSEVEPQQSYVDYSRVKLSEVELWWNNVQDVKQSEVELSYNVSRVKQNGVGPWQINVKESRVKQTNGSVKQNKLE